MVDQNITSFFNEIYDSTNKQALSFVAAKCSNLEDISDILQETYMEVYKVIAKRGVDYIENGEAFVIKIAKQKVYRHYSLLNRLKAEIPLSALGDREEEGISELNSGEYSAEDSVEDVICTEETINLVKKAISEKPVEIQKIFFLKYSMELTIPEISRLMNIGQPEVKNKLYRTITELRKIYGGKGDDDE